MENLLLLLPDRPQSIAARYGATLAIVGAFFLARVGLGEAAGVYGFYLLLPGVFLCALLFDRGSGILAAVASAILVLIWLEPTGRLAVDERHILPVLLFLLVALGLAAVSEALRKALERAVRAEREKDLLFRELAHRTRNNLQLISSILALQARGERDPALREALKAAVARVEVIAVAQERLQPDGGEGTVDLRDYLEELCRHLGDGLRGTRAVAVRVEAEPIVAPSAKAAPIGLIVNELVTNAFKYAFPDGTEGSIAVRLARVGASEVELSVRDDGVGCEDPKDGLGSRLVRLLAQQLGGRIERAPGRPGCVVAARFPLR